jgi:hypothetical protein
MAGADAPLLDSEDEPHALTLTAAAMANNSPASRLFIDASQSRSDQV